MSFELDQLTHATVITGNREKNKTELQKLFQEKKLISHTPIEVFVFEYESLKIDMLRDEIFPILQQKNTIVSRFFIISAQQYVREAQHAFLKNLEEPEQGTHIILLVDDVSKLLPTILSRAPLIAGDTSRDDSRLTTEAFLPKSLTERFLFIETWTKNKNDEDNVSKSEIISFINSLEKELWERTIRDEQLYTDIRQVRDYVDIRGSSHRVLLDFLAMICPVIKQ